MISCYDDFLTLHEKKLYLYGAKNVASEIRIFLDAHDVDFNGYIISKPENNKAEILGKPVKTLNELKNEFDSIAVIVACAPNFKKEIANQLLNAGVYKIYILSDPFASSLQTQAKCRALFNEYAPQFSFDIPMHIERWQAIIKNSNSNDSFRLRTEINRLWDLTQNADRNLFVDDNLKREFETLWTKFIDIKELPHSRKNVNTKASFNIFSIKCHVDKIIENNNPPSYMQELQAGAAIAPVKICELADDVGENISDRNKDFSETSAIYWAWKNATEKQYVGCMHYRRRLDLTDDDLISVLENDVDLVNTVPAILYPSIRKFFMQNFLFDKDWSLMLEGIERLHPEYLRSAIILGEGHYYLANNIMIMKSVWFKKMGSFVFDILLYIDNYYRAHNFKRQDRYAGYIFEFLYSVFVFHHAKEMKIAFADMDAKVFY